MSFLKMTDLDLRDKRLLIREDLNVPLKEGKVANDARIRAALPTITRAIDAGARVILISHLGRPVEGQFEAELSLAPVASYLSDLLGQEVALVRDWIDGVSVAPGQVVLGENVRFLVGEKADDDALAKKMAALCDIFVMDAFGTAHRAQASTHGVGRFAKVACAGPLMAAELEALGKALAHPKRPLVAIVSGSKVSTKVTVLDKLTQIADQLIIGGGIANTFLAAAGKPVGKSLLEESFIPEAQRLMAAMAARGGAIPLPTDVVCATAFSADAEAITKPVEAVAADEMILDVGPNTAQQLAQLARSAKTIVWNGPLGVFEFDQFGAGTKTLASAIAESEAFSLAGGGDTLAAIDKYGVEGGISYISTGGGALMEYLEGKTLPAVAMLEQRYYG